MAERLRGALLACLLLGGGGVALAATPVDIYDFPNTETEARYRALIDEFRCPKCLNTNLSGSDAPIAQDLRRTVHRLLVEEQLSDAEIREFLQSRYGDFVLYNPPFRPDTWILWLAPAVFLGIGLLVLVRMVTRPRQEASLSPDEQARLARILREEEDA